MEIDFVYSRLLLDNRLELRWYIHRNVIRMAWWYGCDELETDCWWAWWHANVAELICCRYTCQEDKCQPCWNTNGSLLCILAAETVILRGRALQFGTCPFVFAATRLGWHVSWENHSWLTPNVTHFSFTGALPSAKYNLGPLAWRSELWTTSSLRCINSPAERIKQTCQ